MGWASRRQKQPCAECGTESLRLLPVLDGLTLKFVCRHCWEQFEYGDFLKRPKEFRDDA